MSNRRSGPPRQLMNLSHKGAGKTLIGPRESGEAGSFNLDDADPPKRTYSAEICALQFFKGEIYFVFGQRKLIGTALETAISLRMHGFYAKQFLKSIETMKSPSFPEIAGRLGLKADELEEIKENPSSVAKMSANVIQAAMSGYDTTLDFYQFSALTAAKAQRASQKIELLPVARVELRTTLFLAIYEQLRKMEPDLPDGELGGAFFTERKI